MRQRKELKKWIISMEKEKLGEKSNTFGRKSLWNKIGI